MVWLCLLWFAFPLVAQEAPPAAEPSEEAVSVPETAPEGERYGLPLVGPSRPTDPRAHPLSPREKLAHYLRAYQPQDFLRSAFWSGISQARNDPPEWGGGMDGYGRRVGSRFANHTLRRSIEFGIGLARKEDPRFFRSNQTGFFRRTAYVATRAVLVRNDYGQDTIAAGRLTAAFAAPFISNAWQPPSNSGVGNALSRGAGTLAGDFAIRMLQEFWPDIRRGLFGRKQRAADRTTP